MDPKPKEMRVVEKRAHHRLPYGKKWVFRKYTYEGRNTFHESSKYSIEAMLSVLHGASLWGFDYVDTPAGDTGDTT